MRRTLLFMLLAYLFAGFFTACEKAANDSPNRPGGTVYDTLVDNPEPQPEPYLFSAYKEKIGFYVNGFYEALPPWYDSTDEKFPVVVVLHGSGELGNGSDRDLPLLLGNYIAKRIANKSLPVRFTSGGITSSFIFIFPQFLVSPTPKGVNDVFDYALTKYRVDSSRLYLTGLSLGGGAVWEYAASKYGNRLAAMAPVCGSIMPDTALANHIILNNVPAWAFHNDNDHLVTVHNTKQMAQMINVNNPPNPVRVTIWPTGWHDAWTKASNPNYREDGKNLYEWFLDHNVNSVLKRPLHCLPCD